ncbi:chemotaxis protein CheB [Gloeocapsopsis dulcis]|uniref:protein-glutamate methylesterase n=1 Tax=Gloeocapsopsis dulcis AAB1 = 1H9 TaxID=1433147 RepID=A0A6N8FX15_9CHRO|nr:chemotaxis protein CheB [Gloeocapsopsis dulcis]MUL37419.1 chemotaxis protein CheB [Gloeocapsopsis dulcis AAB1 = 1H9]WNN87393.1 chemotaxis protein CheB [Gloeocapsopsis dulcis]
MSGCDIIVVGASAGGVEALEQLVRNLPLSLPAAIFVVLHIPSHAKSVLPSILNRCIEKQHKRQSLLKAIHPQDGAEIQHNQIYIAPPAQHLLVNNGYIRLARGPKENSHRPAVDPLFRTAARTYGQRVVGVILSGTLDDGTAGLAAIKQQGGIAIAQDPQETLYSGMPRSAIENVAVDHILPVAKIASVLVELANKPIEKGVKAVSQEMEIEADMAELELGAMQRLDRPGKPSSFGCPECGGVLWELQEGELSRFRCRTGHAYSINSLLAEQSDALEEALWNALRALEEKATLSQRLATQARDRNRPYSANRFQSQGEDAQARATLVRQLLLKGEGNGQVSTINEAVGSSETATELATEQQEIIPATASFPVVAIAASAGGLKALTELLSPLKADFPAAITVVQHVSPHHPSQMANILSHRIALPVKEAEQGDQLVPGQVYIAPPNKHLLVSANSTLCLSDAQLVNFLRPSADLLFESVAASFQAQAIAVVLTGIGSDGAMGIRAIKQMGGKAIAQDLATSEFFGMPGAAIDTGSIDLVVPLEQMASILVRLVTHNDESTLL